MSAAASAHAHRPPRTDEAQQASACRTSEASCARARRDPRSDRPDRASAFSCCILVRPAEKLRQYERGSLLSIERAEGVLNFEGIRIEHPHSIPHDAAFDRRPNDLSAHMVRADVPSDREQPHEHGSVPTKARQRLQSSQIRVLRQVFRLARGTQPNAHPPYRSARSTDKFAQGMAVPIDRGHRQQRQMVRRDHRNPLVHIR